MKSIDYSLEYLDLFNISRPIHMSSKITNYFLQLSPDSPMGSTFPKLCAWGKWQLMSRRMSCLFDRWWFTTLASQQITLGGISVFLIWIRLKSDKNQFFIWLSRRDRHASIKHCTLKNSPVSITGFFWSLARFLNTELSIVPADLDEQSGVRTVKSEIRKPGLWFIGMVSNISWLSEKITHHGTNESSY